MKNNDFSFLNVFLFASAAVSVVWLFYHQNNQVETGKKEQIQLLENYNNVLQIEIERMLNSTEEQIKKKREYRQILIAQRKLVDLIKPNLTSIDSRLKDTKNPKQARQGEPLKIEIDFEQTVGKIFGVLRDVSKRRNLGIKPKEISRLTIKLADEFNILRTKTGPINQLNEQLFLLKKKNSLLNICFNVNNFLCSKIGSTSTHFWHPFIVSSAESCVTEIGEAFNAELFIVDRPVEASTIISASVNGVEYPVKDGILKFRDKPTVKGRQAYTVSFKTKNRYTGKTDVFKKTFSYLVQ